MTEIDALTPGVYVLAVSGGIDSVVLFDMLSYQPDVTLVVAHADHGIRSDSHQDRQFVQQLAEQYACQFESTTLRLDANASEERARHARYEFLQNIQQKYKAQAIITAHHADDVVETVIINMLRGTGWRGLCSLRSTKEVVRPLLAIYKDELRAYAKLHKLIWQEDSTNQSSYYLRNYVRLQLLPKAVKRQPDLKLKIHALWERQCRLRDDIESEVAQMHDAIADADGLKRQLFMRLEDPIADEVLRYFLLTQNIRQTYPQRLRALHFIKTAVNAKRFSLNKGFFLQLTRDHIVVVPVKN